MDHAPKANWPAFRGFERPVSPALSGARPVCSAAINLYFGRLPMTIPALESQRNTRKRTGQPNRREGSTVSQDVLTPARVSAIHKEAGRRRTFAVISHPDAGKSTLTEALALHAKVIGTAGASSGKANRKETVSDWMQMEKDRGISISSAALQFSYRDTVINLLDTPGHADFSEDTYRVLAAVDCAVMLVDAAKGLETQTMKLFGVCKQRNLPIITVINKWDRPGLDALALMDEITERTGLQPMPLTWAVGISGDFRGVWDLRNDRFARFQRNNAGAQIAITEYFTPEEAAESQGNNWSDAVDEAGLVVESNLEFDV